MDTTSTTRQKTSLARLSSACGRVGVCGRALAVGLLALTLLATTAPPTHAWPLYYSQNSKAGDGETTAGDPVDIATGAHIVHETFATLPGRVPMSLGWTFRSQDDSDGPMGMGTSLSSDIFLVADPNDTYRVVTPGDHHFIFTRVGTANGYKLYRSTQSQTWAGATLYVAIGDVYATGTGARGFIRWPGKSPNGVVDHGGGTLYFNAIGALFRIANRYGSSAYIYRNTYGYTTAITTGGRAVYLYYDAPGGRLSEVRLPNTSTEGTRSWKIAYNSAGRFSQITDPQGGVTRYEWGGYTPAGWTPPSGGTGGGGSGGGPPGGGARQGGGNLRSSIPPPDNPDLPPLDPPAPPSSGYTGPLSLPDGIGIDLPSPTLAPGEFTFSTSSPGWQPITGTVFPITPIGWSPYVKPAGGGGGSDVWAIHPAFGGTTSLVIIPAMITIPTGSNLLLKAYELSASGSMTPFSVRWDIFYDPTGGATGWGTSLTPAPTVYSTTATFFTNFATISNYFSNDPIDPWTTPPFIVRGQDAQGRQAFSTIETKGNGSGGGGGSLPEIQGPYPLIIRIIDRSGNVRIHNYYDTQGRVIKQAMADSSVTTFKYESGLTTVSDIKGNKTQYAYTLNTLGYDVTALTDALGCTTTIYRNGPYHQVSQITDFRNRSVTYTYDTTTGFLKTVTMPKASGGTQTVTYDYDPTWQVPFRYTDPIGRITTAEIDTTTGNVKSVQTPFLGARGRKVEFFYDSLSGDLTDLKLTIGNQPWESPPGGTQDITSHFVYNSSDGQIAYSDDPLLRRTSYYYDTDGRCYMVQLPDNRAVRYAFNRMDQVTDVRLMPEVSVPEYQGLRVLHLNYDVEGRVSSFQNALNNTWSYAYDKMDRVIASTNPLGQVSQLTYDNNGNVTAVQNPLGQRAEYTYAYGQGDRPLSMVLKNGAGGVESTISYTYNATTKLLDQITDSASGTYQFFYDSIDRMVSNSTPVNGYVTQQLDDLGRVTSVSSPGQTTGYTYDVGDNVATMTRGGTGWLRSYQYDDMGRLVKTFLGQSARNEYHYDKASQTIYADGVTNTYDVVGRLISELFVNTNTLNTYQYDNLGQLTAATRSGQTAYYFYDNAGNRTGEASGGVTRQWVYNAANQPTTRYDNSIWARTYTHDAAGNLTSAVGPTTSEQYTWNARGNLTSATVNGSSKSFTYNLGSQRTGTSVNGTNTLSAWEGWTPTGFFSEGLDRHILTNTGAEIVQNLRGDVVGQFTSTQSWTQSFDAFGKTVSSSGPGTPPSTLGFTGAQNDGNGLYYMRHRYYSPELGRFISQDPIGFAGGLNLYAYCGNDPINFTDPLGLFSFTVGEYQFDDATVGNGLATGFNGLASGMSFGLYDGGAYKCEIGFQFSKAAGTVASSSLAAAGGVAGINALRAAAASRAAAAAAAATAAASNPTIQQAEHAGENYVVNNWATENAMLNAARDARDALARSYINQGYYPSTVTAGYNPTTGRIAAAQADALGCAERAVARELGSNCQFTEAIRPRLMDTSRWQVPVCLKCQTDFDVSQFPWGTIFGKK